MGGARWLLPSMVAGATVLVGFVACQSPDSLDAWPAALEIRSPALQTGLTDYPVNDPPAVRLVDSDGNPIAGARITFAVTGGGGAVTGSVAATGADGVARVGAWSVALGFNTLEASIPAPFRVPPVTFTATGVPAAYRIDFSYITLPTPERRAAFDRAAARWQLAIYGDVADITVDIPAGSCLGNEPPIDRPIDDLLIFVTLDSIDGPSGIIGGATPCFIRLAGKLPLVGAMVFDTADVAMLVQSGRWGEVVLHEVGHVLGFGALWSQNAFNLIVGEGGADPHFVGGRGRAAFDRMGGTGYTAGAKVPVENTGPRGTRDVHWRESALGVELMTGYLNMANVNPLSVATLASLEDEGYLVNYAAADALALAFVPAVRGPAQPAGVRILLQNDVLRVPIREVDGAGRVTGIYRP